MTSPSSRALLVGFGLVIAALHVSASPSEAPWLVGRTAPQWAEVEPRRTLQVEHELA
jgi:hypothetical protein